uniref:Thymosin beta 1 n=1 Tax=Acanthochromis polyacanthus TaxID=80966 RepID=A0A3Q1EPW9_9TELE
MNDNPVKQEVTKFDKKKLKKTNTEERTHMPTKEIEEEKKAMQEAK